MRKLKKVIFLTCLFLVLVHAVASFFPKERLWGLSLLHYVPPFFRFFLIGFGLLMLIPPTNRFVADGLAKLLALAENGLKGINKYYKYALISLASFFPFWIFKIKTYLLGDGNLRVAEIVDGWTFSATAPLDFYLHAFLSRLLKLNPFTTYAILSCLAGVLFIFLILLLSDLLGKEGQRKLLIFSVLASMGANQLFFGYVESYTLMYAAQAGFVLFSLYYLKGRCGFFWPSLIFILSISLHLSAIFLLPSVLYLSVAKKSQEAEAKNEIFTLGNIIKIVSILLIVGGGLLILRHYNPQKSDLSSFLIFPLGGGEDHYYLFSLPHLLDFLNHQLLISPLGIPIWLALGLFFLKRINFKKREVVFLLILSVCTLVFALVVDPKLGYPRDWDLFAFCGLGYTILGVYLLINIMTDAEVKSLRYLTLALTSTTLISTLPWVYVNATEEKAVERVTHILELDGKRSALGHEALAYYYRNHSQKEKEIEEWKKAIALFEKPRYIKNLGVVYIEVGKYQEAAWQLEKILDKDPDDHLTCSDLGKVYAALGKHKEAKQQFQRAIELQPDNPLYYENLGYFFLNLRSYEESKETFRKALQVDSSYFPNYRNLGMVYANLGENKEAIKYLELYLKHEPQARDRNYIYGLIKQLKVKVKETRP
ncbi:MAG: tetratricopeptide repeat protein [Candidatus Zixiibacteriota bacterium]